MVLCCLEGLTRDEAAARLGVPLTTLKSQLDRGRQKLAGALTRRGVALGVGLLLGAVTSPAGACPPRLVAAALTAASGAAPKGVRALAEGAGACGTVKRFVAAAVLLGVVGVAVAFGPGAGPEHREGAKAPARKPPGEPQKPNPTPPGTTVRPTGTADEKVGKDAGETVTYRGRVLGPDGKPVAGAKLYAEQSYRYTGRPKTLADRTTTDAEGRFEFRVPRALFEGAEGTVAATAPKHGLGWVELGVGARDDDLTIRLSGEDTPVMGQIVTLEGKPVPGVRVTAVQVSAAAQDDLGPWLRAIKQKRDNDDPEWEHLRHRIGGMGLAATTDATGRFELRGIGSNRLVRLRLEGPTVSTQDIRVLTRTGETLTVKHWEGDPQFKRAPTFLTYYAANFRHPAAPTRPIVGVVRDRDSGKPLGGVTIRGYKFADRELLDVGEAAVEATTDKEGRYRLVGMPRGTGNEILAVPGPDQPYLLCRKAVADPPGLNPVTVDYELKRGVWIEGKVTDTASGRPVRVAVEYFATRDNPNRRDHPGFENIYGFFYSDSFSKTDGSYRVVGIPGAGLVVTGRTREHLCTTERDDEFGRKEGHIAAAPNFLGPLINFTAIASVEAKAGAESTRRDVTLDPGWTFTGSLIGPDGKPVTGAQWLAVESASARWTDKMEGAAFTVAKFNPKSPRDILFRHAEKGLVGILQPPAENGGRVTVRMQPGATVTGRLLDADGRPRAGIRVELWVRTKQTPHFEDYSPKSIVTDKDGRFRIEALVPEFRFMLFHTEGTLEFGDGLRSGEVKDLGDVRLKAGQ
ncbi:hypothetical protein FTUN_7511 [Frigoriglobus tundricola]|uniref:RNA polymerase sigma factor 70 region 4 type 2 domain-containing protein n=1 Tax=Frigoriglobus tundricola TaxID=2774151 RepID=A0A6M5Z142_9BACT|nr:hypothetical protein FTUN_7511 [Frigoriglobus tundricola]